jgi:peptide chain release factor 3
MTGIVPLSPATPHADNELVEEIRRRRTFAIISHPDAGKTTLTEKFLLYGGAVEEAGSVRARRNARRSTSDWMALERERGISITSTALQFDAFGCRFNLLDTPGHQDFSEDTYRTLMAADSAIMVLDSAKGIESQTRKLFDVCRARRIPILTFINKLDHPGRDPLELLDEIESTLQIGAIPMNWPIGDGPSFQGVYDLRERVVLRFSRTEGGRFQAPVSVGSLDDPLLARLIGDQGQASLREQIALVQALTPDFDTDAFLAGDVTPVFFGSALNNFGVEPFLEALRDLAPSPRARKTTTGDMSPYEPVFTGFVFKIQANMDPLHRDRMAFLRICSGRFEKDMTVHHQRLGRRIKLSRPHRLFARERETVEEAYAGDVVGLINPGIFTIGDSVSSGDPVEFEPIPRFELECFAQLEVTGLARMKQFARGLQQLEEEGAVSVFTPLDAGRSVPILGAVGNLQFDVVLARLKDEYGVDAHISPMSITIARRLSRASDRQSVSWPRGTVMATDDDGSPVALFRSQWDVDYCLKQNPSLVLEPL